MPAKQMGSYSGGCTCLSSAWSWLAGQKSQSPLALGPTGLWWWLPFRGRRAYRLLSFPSPLHWSRGHGFEPHDRQSFFSTNFDLLKQRQNLQPCVVSHNQFIGAMDQLTDSHEPRPLDGKVVAKIIANLEAKGLSPRRSPVKASRKRPHD